MAVLCGGCWLGMFVATTWFFVVLALSEASEAESLEPSLHPSLSLNGSLAQLRLPNQRRPLPFHNRASYTFTRDDPRSGPPSVLLQPNSETPYVITQERLKQIRSQFLYWFFDKGGDSGNGDYQSNIHPSSPQIHKNLNFQLPFFGFRFNYTRVSIHGYLEFSDPPDQVSYPMSYPVRDWPRKNDPSFIGIFYSKCRIGSLKPDDIDQRKPGVYFRMERDLRHRTDQIGVEMRERLKWDLREGMVGADNFNPKHSAIITWKNVTFAGGIESAQQKTNTFQLVLATDEVMTYAMFNYVDMQWTSHTEAGGDTTLGEGGIPAYVGFNAGNGTRSFEYLPFSQMSTIRDLTGRGWANGFPGRHIFRIDENILVGTCNRDIAGATLPLMFAPESGNMLGGTIVNITGPCFDKSMKIKCRFDVETVEGTVVDRNRAICVQPYVLAEGYILFDISINGGKYIWKGKYFIETPATATQRIFFDKNAVHERYPQEIKVTWNEQNLTSNTASGVQFSLWGYREKTIKPELIYIDTLESGLPNNGKYNIIPSSYKQRRNDDMLDLAFGFLQINLTNPISYNGVSATPVIWSQPIPLGWYFAPQWERYHGKKWPEQLCDNWLKNDRFLKNFASELAQCPCTLEQAIADKGRFLADYDCDIDANPDCFYHRGARHCVKTGSPSMEGSEQQCCYDKNNYLMMSYDQMWGSSPKRSSNLGLLPWNEANKVPTLSQWYNDMIPFYKCCLWQEEQAVGCETYRFERRPTQDCTSYQAPYVGTVFGDPHFITFDDLEYTFNGMGEYVLVRSQMDKYELSIQARFEQLPRNLYGPTAATHLTSIAAQDNSSTTIEVRIRPQHAQWRYRLDVFADSKRVFFDRPSLRMQRFKGVTVYQPSYILNQSEIVLMFQSGIGVEVVESKGYMAARVYLPWTYINKTRGLLGNWSFNAADDFVLPDGIVVTPNMNDFQRIYRDFGMKWALDDRADPIKGKSLFLHEYGRSASYYLNRTFQPVFEKNPQDIIPANRSKDLQIAEDICGDSYQCKYDYALSLNRDLATTTLKYFSDYTQIKSTVKNRVITCGVLETPRFGRKTNFFFVPGTKISFECNQNFVLVGDNRRECTGQGHWNYPEEGFTECLRYIEYDSRQLGKTAIIIVGILLPLLLVLICCGTHMYRKAKKEDQTEKPWLYITRNKIGGDLEKRKKSGGQLERGSADSLGSQGGGTTTKKRRRYDGVYLTHEPIAGAPEISQLDEEPDSPVTLERLPPAAYFTDATVEKHQNRPAPARHDSLQTDIY